MPHSCLSNLATESSGLNSSEEEEEGESVLLSCVPLPSMLLAPSVLYRPWLFLRHLYSTSRSVSSWCLVLPSEAQTDDISRTSIWNHFTSMRRLLDTSSHPLPSGPPLTTADVVVAVPPARGSSSFRDRQYSTREETIKLTPSGS